MSMPINFPAVAYLYVDKARGMKTLSFPEHLTGDAYPNWVLLHTSEQLQQAYEAGQQASKEKARDAEAAPVGYFYKVEQCMWMQCWPSDAGAVPLYARKDC